MWRKLAARYPFVVETVELSLLDRRLLRALDADGRAQFSRIAASLGVSEHTVARRYRRLRSAGIRVVGEVEPSRTGAVSWFVRVRCTPDAAQPVAAALARRDDTSWVVLSSGGTEITCHVHGRHGQHADELLLQKLPRTPRVTSVSAHYVLHEFAGAGQNGRRRLLSLPGDAGDPAAAAGPPAPRADGRNGLAVPVRLDAIDEALLAVLARDGRASYGEMADAAATSQSTVRRRLDRLLACGAVTIGLELDPAVLGLNAVATLWLTVAPADLAAVGETLASHPEVPFAAATTGPTNLVASVACRDTGELYRYLTERIGALRAVRQVETAPRIRTLKRGVGSPVP